MKNSATAASPDVRRALRESPVSTILATGFGAGFAPIAPGTAGSAVALAAAWLFARALSPSPHMISVVAAVGLLMSGLAIAFLAVPVVGRAAAAMGREDPGCIVLDEMAGQLLASAVVPLFAYPTPGAAAAAWLVSFFAFRLFDVWKPGPIRGWQAFPGGWGIVVDDVAAGLLAAVVTSG
ncbi:MAG TPA: phosphatidylglycerophosphatase A, partial [Thermoanaerobaculia bacterium]|nr:phosphatidylglycerophosphatase A [Thermoanaerobaculia bacterium]